MKLNSRDLLNIIKSSIRDSFTDEKIIEQVEQSAAKANAQGEEVSNDFIEGAKQGMKIASKTILVSFELSEAIFKVLEDEEDE